MMTVTGLKTALKILDKWGCSSDQIQAILQISRATYFKYRKKPDTATLTHDQAERISLLLNIHAALRTIFENPENTYGFISMKNDNPYFNGKSP